MGVTSTEQASIFTAEPVRCAVIAGSQRAVSETTRVARYIAARCRELTGQDAFLLDLGQTALPVCESGDSFDGAWDAVSTALHRCDALVVVTPEWGGAWRRLRSRIFSCCVETARSHISPPA